MIQLNCSQCGIQILVPPTVQGREGICFGCGAPLQVPVSKEHDQVDLTFAEGTRISGRYLLHEKIGQGGMGVVHRAEDTLVKEMVALKFMKPQLLKTQQGQLGFIREAQIARRLRHENIVAVHDLSWTNEGVLYITMEFLSGPSLRAMLRRHRQERRLIDVRLAISIINQILGALEYAHRTVIHRDIKPENIMLLPGEHVKVLDFGLAKAVDEQVKESSGSGAEKRISGTWAYASPEQKKHWPVDFRSDIYSVGLVLYELLTLRTPTDEYVKVERVRSDVAPSILTILDRAVANEPQDRFPSAKEFRQAINEAYQQSYRTTTDKLTSSNTASTDGMVFLEGGSFVMGNNEVEEEGPEFEAHVEPFYIDKYPVTVAQYEKFAKTMQHPLPKFWHDERLRGPMQPVVGVSWDDACAYAAWAGKQLPSEAQWEFAARGRESRVFPWGNLGLTTDRCNYDDYLGMPSIVSMHEEGQTPEGVCDLAGNVYEWTRDPFVPYKQKHSAPETPMYAVRGGSWHSPADETRCTFRKGLFREAKLTTLGFRCVVPAKSEKKD